MAVLAVYDNYSLTPIPVFLGIYREFLTCPAIYALLIRGLFLWVRQLHLPLP